MIIRIVSNANNFPEYITLSLYIYLLLKLKVVFKENDIRINKKSEFIFTTVGKNEITAKPSLYKTPL